MSALAFAPDRPRARPAAAAGPILQRKCAACGTRKIAGESCTACGDGPLLLRRRSGPAGGGEIHEAGPIVHAVLSSPGTPLPRSVRSFLEPRLGHDFSAVRIHRDSKAAVSAAAVEADAYTVGNDIVFGAGKWDGATPSPILAHELAHVVQQSGSRAGDGPLTISSPGDAAEREADLVANRLMTDRAVRPGVRAGGGLFRQAQGESAAPAPARTIDGSAASISWIDPSSPAGASVPDPAPPAAITTSFVTGNSGFRFSNYLHAWISSSDSIHVAGQGFHTDSGIYRGPSFLGIPSHAYSTQRNQTAFNEGGVDGVEFEQLTGARTISAGVIGGGVGAGVGIGAGIWAGAKGGGAIGAFGGPIGAVGGAIIGGIVGGGLGWLAGSAVANRATNFPPIWTRIRLRLKADGTRRCEMVQHSLFPSNNFYCDLSQIRAYSALAAEQTAWEGAGWNGGNPWGASRPLVTP